jgi:UDP-N-acetylglucosamine acyltransferase
MKIHSTAIVAREAQIGDGVEIGPYSIIGPHVRLGNGTRLLSHVVIDGHTQIGENCRIYSGACLGYPPQDKKFKDEPAYLFVGNDNMIREYVTMNAGSAGSKTVVGDRNFIMIQSHIGHDCVVGNDVTIANNSALGGHCVVEDKAVLGGLTGIHQNVRIGKMAMVGALSKASMDIPPFSLCDGHLAKVHGLNLVGLRRGGFTSKEISEIKQAFKTLLLSGLNWKHAAPQVEKELGHNENVRHLLSFLKTSKRGVARGVKSKGQSDVEE